jgi:BMFP domain-containing protein YqiC
VSKLNIVSREEFEVQKKSIEKLRKEVINIKKQHLKNKTKKV